ncbi:MAG TPA: PaaI family thioesterase [Gemmatimonadaceae bacterium]|nr:PaaI family thioesterase [Gemmatimonadaceae bacterium]
MTLDAERRIRASFGKQTFMRLLGAQIAHVAPGEVDIALPFRPDLVQQHGFLHAGVTAAIADSACGYAALSLMPADAAVLSVEYKVNMLAPAKGERFLARGRVIRSGRTVTVCRGEVLAFDAQGDARPVLEMLGTMMTARDRGIVD